MCVENMGILHIDFKKELKYFAISLPIMFLTGMAIGYSGILNELSVVTFYLILFAYVFIMCTILQKNIIKGLVTGAFTTLMLFGIDGVTHLFYRLINLSDTFDALDIDRYWMIAFFVFLLLHIVVVLLLSRFLKKRIDMNIFNNKSLYFIAGISGLMIIISFINFMEDTFESIGDVMYALVFVSVIILYVIIVINAYKENSVKTEKMIAEASQKYISDLEESYTVLRTIKHDYVNIMTSFKLYIENDDMEGLAEYYNNELSEMNKDLLSQDKLLGSLQNIKINEIKSILIYKCSIAAGVQIEPNIEVREVVDELGVSTAIVCQILGILMDNAIEAVEEIGNKELSIAIIKNPNSKAFVIKNTWNKQEIAVDKLFELGFSTKAKERGIGLYTVRNYTNKISNLYLETEIDTDYFTQTLTVKDAK